MAVTPRAQLTAGRHYQARGWRPWHRFTAAAILALAVLAGCAARATEPAPADPTRYARNRDPIALTITETRRLINALIISPVHDPAHALHWSR
ncbi:hypothetical protein ACNTMW_16475 [Planosporangium sp. 12N6]|uniref:hypothetical protein n=1 Tax=Planosporangium spinosum TaxID=3402278 RepID=UPI003CECB47E